TVSAAANDPSLQDGPVGLYHACCDEQVSPKHVTPAPTDRAQEVAGEGRTLLPGLMDAHVHLPFFSPVDALQQTLIFGVTTAVVMWAAPAIVSQVKASADRPDVAAVLTAGIGATAPGGHPTQMDGSAQARLVSTLTAPAEADAFVAARLAEGSDFI